MSKYKKKNLQDVSGSYETDIRLERSITFMGWLYLLAIIGYLGVWLIFDSILDVPYIDIQSDVYSLTYLAFTGTASAFSFGIVWNIKNNREKKKQLVNDWLLGQFLLGLFTILPLGVYLW